MNISAPKHTIRLFFAISLFFISYSSYAQQTILTNPSFEATAPCENCVASTWTNCANTPDVLNGDNSIWCVDIPPQEGSTYAGITNGEYIGQYLSCPLVAGRTYTMTVWLAYDNVYASTMVLGACADYRNNPGNLEIIGGFNSCQVNEVLWTSGILTGPSDTWVQYTATFTPSATYDYVMFRNDRIGPTGGNNATGGSNVCMDNFDLIGDEATITSTDATCSGFGNDGEATVFPPNNGTNWGIVWSDGQTTPTATNLAAGTYTVTLTDLDGFCQVPITLTAIIDGPPLISASGTPDIICPGDNVQLNVSVAPPPPPAPCIYTLNLFDSFGDGWGNSNGDGYVQVYVNGALIGTYYVLTNQTNYSTTFSVYQGDNIQLVYSASGSFNNENSYQLLNASSAIVYSSGTNPAGGSGWTGVANCGNPPPPTYTYSWSPSTTLNNSSIANPVATPTTTTTYTVSVVSSNNLSCPAMDSVTITINPTASGTDVITSCTPITWIDGNNYTASTNT
ncbi:MAG: hypothetical protein HYU69_04215, partial [Bacteroidetes bacterium]|nr:hypothetical protein [Bacteroidota bacterium]